MSHPVDFMSWSVDFVSWSVDFMSPPVDFWTVLAASVESMPFDTTHDKGSRYRKNPRNETAIFDLKVAF